MDQVPKKVEMGVDLVLPALTLPDGISYWIYMIMTAIFAIWVIYLVIKH